MFYTVTGMDILSSVENVLLYKLPEQISFGFGGGFLHFSGEQEIHVRKELETQNISDCL